MAWNDGENFASLGIGHFIWFPKDKPSSFQESFPDLLRWFEQKNVRLPHWLNGNTPCPWQNKAEFLAAKNQPRIQALRQLLNTTQLEQTSFIMFRLQQALPKMLASISSISEQQHIQQQFQRVASARHGWYALADYVNFKGEGINPQERYHEQGWGLVHVLLHMDDKIMGQTVMQEFVRAASFILQRRVALSPIHRNEQRWLAGWNKRLNTYLKP